MWWKSWATDNRSRASFTCPGPFQDKIMRIKGRRWMIGSIRGNLTWCVRLPNKESPINENRRRILLLTSVLKCFIDHRRINCQSTRSILIGMSMQIQPIISTCMNMASQRHLEIVLSLGLPIVGNQKSASRPKDVLLRYRTNKPNG